MTPHETGSTATPGTPRATAPPPRTFGRQGPTLEEAPSRRGRVPCDRGLRAD